MRNNKLFVTIVPIIFFCSGITLKIKKEVSEENHSPYYFRRTTFIKANQNARFILAYNRTMTFEGYYANDKSDRGGETYKGISRKFHMNWEGWKLIDSCKTFSQFPKNLLKVSKLEEIVKKFYKEQYWDKMKGDEIVYQDLANELFDACVNLGLKQGIKLFQKTLNVPTTGLMDETTLKAVNNR